MFAQWQIAFFSRFLFEPLFFAIFANVAFFLRCLFRSLFFSRCSFQSLFFAIIVRVALFFRDFCSRLMQIIVQIAFFFAIFVRVAFLRFSLMSLFLPMRSKRTFRALVLKKFGNVNLPTHFCKSQIAFLNIIFFIAQLQKSDFAGHRFFFGDFCSHRISAPFFWWAHVSNAILLHFFRCGHASIAFSQVLE